MNVAWKSVCAGFLLAVAVLFSASGLANQAEDFAQIAEADVGKNGAWYGYDMEWCARVIKLWANQAGIGYAIPDIYFTPSMAKWFNEQGSGFHLTRRDATGEIKCWTSGSWTDDLPEPDYGFMPQVGDIVFFETDGNPDNGIDHVGVCVGVEGFTIMTVEGNTGNSDNSKSVVSSKTYQWAANESKVWGFARPEIEECLTESESVPNDSQLTIGPDPGGESPEDSETGVEEETAASSMYAEIQEIPQNQMDAVLVLDTSGSMSAASARTGKEILTYAKEAASAFIDQAFMWNENYQIALATFDSDARQIQEMVGKQGVEDLRRAVASMSANGQTNVASGFDKASAILDAQGRADARQIIVLFSDGIHNCDGDPVRSGQMATLGHNGQKRDIYTVGLVGALNEDGKKQVRAILDQPYAVRYIEIDDKEQIEGTFYVLALAANSGDPEERIRVLRIRGAGYVEVRRKGTGEVLTAQSGESASFGTVYQTSDNYEVIYVLDEGDYELRVFGDEVRTIGIQMETMNGRAVSVAQVADLRFNGNAGTRLSAELSFADNSFELRDDSFDPYTYEGTDPFTGEYYAPEYEAKVPAGIANLPNGGLVSQRQAGYSASVPNEAHMPDRIHEQHLEIFNPFFESEGFIVESRTSYGSNYDGYTYFFGGTDMKLYRVPEEGGAKEKIINKALRAYWVDETGLYYADQDKIIRRPHGESSGTTIVRHGVASGSNLSRMIRYGEYLYFISAKDRCLYAVPYQGGDLVKLTEESARCFTIAQIGNREIIIYNTYDKARESEYLRAIDLGGNRVSELDELRTINTHYFNYAHGYLYYCKKSENCALYRVNLNRLTENERIANICASRIFLFDDFVVTTDDSKYYCVMRPDGSEFKTIYAPYPGEG